jgi:hypothetical protein
MIDLKQGDIIKHVRNRDVAFRVGCSTAPSDESNFYKIQGQWINLCFEESFRIGILQGLKIPESEMNNWLLCVNPELKCLRQSEWRHFTGEKE